MVGFEESKCTKRILQVRDKAHSKSVCALTEEGRETVEKGIFRV